VAGGGGDKFSRHQMVEFMTQIFMSHLNETKVPGRTTAERKTTVSTLYLYRNGINGNKYIDMLLKRHYAFSPL
jgi:hypothetical protein